MNKEEIKVATKKIEQDLAKNKIKQLHVDAIHERLDHIDKKTERNKHLIYFVYFLLLLNLGPISYII